MESFKQILEFIPLIVFFVLFKIYDMNVAVFGIMISTIIAILLHFVLFRRVSYMLAISSGLVIVFGATSLIFHDPSIFKMKPTICFTLFALIAAYDYLQGAKWLNSGMGQQLSVGVATLKKIEIVWAAFFLLSAVANEFVWRNFDDAIWVNFKLFVLPIANLALVVLSTMYVMRLQQRGQQ